MTTFQSRSTIFKGRKKAVHYCPRFYIITIITMIKARFTVAFWILVCSVCTKRHFTQLNRGKSFISGIDYNLKLLPYNNGKKSTLKSEALKFASAVLLASTLFLPTLSNADSSTASSFSFTSTSLTIPRSVERTVEETVKDIYKKQSRGWELARQKRTIAIKTLEQKGIVSVETDEVGNQFLALPWIPDKKIPYKSLSIKQRLVNEVCAGAFGEISKDALLHAVDTAKTRRQAKKKAQVNTNSTFDSTQILPYQESNSIETDVMKKLQSAVMNLKNLYAGFPIVLLTSIPQGGTFFLVKKGSIEFLNMNAPTLPAILSSAMPIGFSSANVLIQFRLGVMAYWLFRTPAEVIKTQVQTGQLPSVADAVAAAKLKYSNNWLGIWKHYAVMLGLDIPFQIMNFILYGSLSDAVSAAGIAPSVWTRLFCGASCGMVSAAVTCPLDVCKTRIISRDRQPPAEDTVSVSIAPTSVTVPIVTAVGFDPLPEGNLIPYDSDGGGLLLDATKTKSPSDDDAIHSLDATTPDHQEEGKRLPSSNKQNNNIFVEFANILRDEGPQSLFLGFQQRLLYVGLANGIRLAAYGTSRMDLMMKSLDSI